MLTTAVGVGLLITSAASAANIAWLSLHNADGTPSGPAATAGYTMAPDIGYTNLLTSAGHTVTRIPVLPTPALPNVANLNTYDLVIAGRSNASGDWETDPETDAWNTQITKPMIIMSGYLIRNNRLGFASGTTIPDTGGVGNPTGVIKLQTTTPGHPIFQGVALDGTGTMTANYTTGLQAAPYNASIIHRGISVVTNAVQGGGQVLATVNTAGDAANAGMVIGFWPAGAVLTNTTTPDLNDTLGGKRLVFLSGSREEAGDAGKAGLFDLTPEGAQLFLNAVAFMTIRDGDVDGDSDADINDFNVIKNNFQKSVASRSLGDLTLDGLVDWKDFRQWKTAASAPVIAGADAVPEPGTIVLGLMAAAAALGGARGARRGA
jgi:hypothetical protein